MIKKAMKNVLALTLAVAMSFSVVPANFAFAADTEKDFTISNPYETVNWEEWKQYKADFHAHSKNSDGGNFTYEMVEDHYKKGYDILAMTDHNYTTKGWENADEGPMTAERKAEIEAGVGRDGRGMLDFTYGNEQSKSDHINTFGLDWVNPEESSMKLVLDTMQDADAIAHINHMGRYTGSKDIGYVDDRYSHTEENINKYVTLLEEHPNTVGMEIINKLDNESRFDRALWDNILMELMPEGRNVWGFSNDDTHSLNATGYSFNMMLMPELSSEATRESMENGTFYAVSRISRVDEINNINEKTGEAQPGSGNEDTLYLLDQTTPEITKISVDQYENSISIEGANFDIVEWIADGEVVAKGNTIDLNDVEDDVNSYIRAELKSDTGIAFTQPFALSLSGEVEEVEEEDDDELKINNPYADVDWTAFNQYKADFHIHSQNSDGAELTRDMVEDHYAKGYDIISMTDHNYTTMGWENAGEGAMTTERKAEIEAGVGRDGRGMLDFEAGNEQSKADHINTFGLDWVNAESGTMANTLRTTQEADAIAHINHMGRYTGAKDNGYDSDKYSHDPANIEKYTTLLRNNPNTVGMEIINKIDNESRFDRILWDNILMELMPEGRNVWGFSNDDTHSLNATGYSFNMMLMPELTSEATRAAMEDGEFYAVSRVSRVDEINHINPTTGEAQPGSGDETTTYLLDQATPSISNIVVDEEENTITITGADYDTIEWIADGKVVAEGETVDLDDVDGLNSYIRGQLKSETGIAFTQPFGIYTGSENPYEFEGNTTVRIAGDNRIETTARLTQTYFETAENVVLVEQSNYADSIAASVLAGVLKAPILLTESDVISDEVLAEIERLGASKVYIIGGEGSVSLSAEDTVEASYEVERIGGANRYETAALIAEEVADITGGAKTAVIASGETFPDALAISSYAAKEGYPILLVSKNEIPEVTQKAIDSLGITETYVIGGENTISEEVEGQLPGLIERVAGDNRYETATEIAEIFFEDVDSVFIASGEEYSDALVVGPVAGRENNPIILASQGEVPMVSEYYLVGEEVDTMVIVGGTSTISQDVQNELRSY